MVQAVIFDMDGTMFDTELLWGDVDRKLTEKYNLQFDRKVRVMMMGKKDQEALSILKEYFQIPESVEDLIRIRRTMILEDTRLVRVNEGLYELLDLLDKKKCKKAIATSSFREFTSKLLTQFNLNDRFGAVITGDDITASKPDPMIFLEAAGKLGVDPQHCLVLEDAQNGVEAAYNAKMKVFAIPHDDSRNHDFSKATKVLASLKEIDAAALEILK